MSYLGNPRFALVAAVFVTPFVASSAQGRYIDGMNLSSVCAVKSHQRY